MRMYIVVQKYVSILLAEEEEKHHRTLKMLEPSHQISHRESVNQDVVNLQVISSHLSILVLAYFQVW